MEYNNSLNDSLFHDIPFEIICEILSHLSPFEVCQSATVSALFAHLTALPSLWKVICAKDIEELSLSNAPNTPAGSIFDWKSYYREKIAFQTEFQWKPLIDNHADNAVFPSKRSRHGSTVLDHRVLITGGHVKGFDDAGFDRNNEVWTYDTVNKKFAEINLEQAMPKMSRHSLVTVGDMAYSFFGILQDKTKLNDVFTLDLEKSTWSKVKVNGTPPEPRNDSVVKAFGDGKVVVFGGSLEGFVFPSDVHVFDTNTNTWSQPDVHGERPNTRISCAGTVLNNKLYVYGGGYWDTASNDYTSKFHDLWILDLEKWTWSQPRETGTVPKPMGVFCTLEAVGNHLLLDGGREYIFRREGIHIFDTVSETWTKLKYLGFAPNANSCSCSIIGASAYFIGYYPSFVLNLSPVGFLLGEPYKDQTE